MLWLSGWGRRVFSGKSQLGALPRAQNAPRTGAMGVGGQADNPQSLKDTQRNNLKYRPQVHFRNQGFPPAKHSLPVLWRREEGGGRKTEEGGRRCSFLSSQQVAFKESYLRPEGFLHLVCALSMCPVYIPYKKMATCPPGGKKAALSKAQEIKWLTSQTQL